jgi:AraC-like DNA-binding protein
MTHMSHQGCPHRPLAGLGGIIVRRLDLESDLGLTAQDVRRTRLAHPGFHVGLFTSDHLLSATVLETVRSATGADFLVRGYDPPNAAQMVADLLLDPRRLPLLAFEWFKASFPLGSELSKAFFAAMHNAASNRLSMPDVATRFHTCPRTLQHHVARLGRVAPRDIRMLGRLTCVAVDVAREQAKPIGWHAGTHLFLHYPDFYRHFARTFGFPPSTARAIRGPAALWHRWLERHIHAQ